MDTSAVTSELERILASTAFRRGPRQSAFLRYVVEKTLAGDSDQLKEYQIGVHVYGRRPNYDTRQDPIVRVEASRLRAKLAEFYMTDAAVPPLRIEMPRGAYEASFVFADPPGAKATQGLESTPTLSNTNKTPRYFSGKWLVAGALVLVVAGAALFWPRSKSPRLPRRIAVLPIADRIGQSNLLAETLADQLGQQAIQNGEVGVVARSQMAGQSADFRFLEKDLGAEAVIEGSLQKIEGRYHGAARLLVLPSLEQLAAAECESDNADSNAAVSELAATMMTALWGEASQSLRYPRAEMDQMRRRFDQAMKLHISMESESLKKAYEWHRLLAQDYPDWALAQSGLAHAGISLLSSSAADGTRVRQQVLAAIERSMALSPANADAYSARIRWQRDVLLDLVAVDATCAEARRYQAASKSIRVNCAYATAWSRRREQALAQMQFIRRVWPNYSAGLEGHAMALLHLGRYEEALRSVEELRRQFPDSILSDTYETKARLGLKDWIGARRAIASGLRRDPQAHWQWEGFLAYVQARQTETKAAQTFVANSQAPYLARAWAAAGLQDRSQLKALLDRARARAEAGVLEHASDPLIEILLN